MVELFEFGDEERDEDAEESKDVRCCDSCSTKA